MTNSNSLPLEVQHEIEDYIERDLTDGEIARISKMIDFDSECDLDMIHYVEMFNL